MSPKKATRHRSHRSYGLRTVFFTLAALSLILVGVFIYGVSEFVRGLYPVGTMVTIDYSIKIAVYYTLFGMWLLFGVLMIALHFKILDPVRDLAAALRELTESRDWEKNVTSGAEISELDSLVTDINHMVEAVKLEHNKLLSISESDAMTGLLNRRGFEAKFADEIERSIRFSLSFSIILLDMDKFKFINDTYGHPAGDAVLIEFSARLKTILRTVDAFARIGGDEFVIILPETEPNDGLCVAMKLHEAINAALFPTGADSNVMLPVTASIGVACFPQDGEDNGSLLKAVDEVLYKAKKAGKNCVVSLNNQVSGELFEEFKH